MAKTRKTASAAPAGPVLLKYVGPPGAESPRYGALVPGRDYQESDPEFAAYLVAQHPDHWASAAGPPLPSLGRSSAGPEGQ